MAILNQTTRKVTWYTPSFCLLSISCWAPVRRAQTIPRNESGTPYRHYRQCLGDHKLHYLATPGFQFRWVVVHKSIPIGNHEKPFGFSLPQFIGAAFRLLVLRKRGHHSPFINLNLNKVVHRGQLI